MKVIALATPRNSILALDLVRGLAAIEVMLTHLRGGNWVEFGALPTSQRTSVVELFFLSTRLGHEAVLIFFVLSGFLVGGNLISRLRAGRFSIADYAIDRGTRILIPLVPACVLTVSINLGIFSDAVGALQAVGNVFGLNGVLVDTLPRNAPLWSLAYEIWFYVLAGAVAAIFTGKTGPLALMAILFAALVFAKLGALYVLFWSFGALTAQMRCHSTLARRQFLVGLAMVALGLIAYQLGATSKSFSNIVLLSPAHAETFICLGFCASIPTLDGNWINHALAPAGNVIRC
ncbi:acyltransferase family protein [Methylocystis sp. WRRC1]|uniref:acyltransferase family protein n=1 Tax=Methylocystis sp. WRRC1 TaxID=1732014 RepID=UPI001D13F390|nr:acyltransferase family protein [Methylocystis sp. WRRC1]MCC3244474.1 acyltransferase family protein [Methylocystis sp. WRRC1]